ncbi:MAG: hypothetical protein R3D71_02025 [Rickettsiales bacterium]
MTVTNSANTVSRHREGRQLEPVIARHSHWGKYFTNILAVECEVRVKHGYKEYHDDQSS